MLSGIVKICNAMTKVRRARCRPDELLVLLPSCLQNSDCTEKVRQDVNECRRCGRCKVKDMVELCEKYGVRCAVATGGRLALQMATDPSVKAVVAIACEKELLEGLRGLFPKPSLGVINMRPNGPCVDTDVNVEDAEKAIAWFLRE